MKIFQDLDGCLVDFAKGACTDDMKTVKKGGIFILDTNTLRKLETLLMDEN